MEVQTSPVPCGVQHCQAREDRNLRTSFISTCRLTGWGPAGISPPWTCQQASCSILNLSWPIFPLTECSGCFRASVNSPPLILWVTFPSASPPVKVVPAWLQWPLTALDFIYHSTPQVIQILNLGRLCFSAYNCRAFHPCAILLVLNCCLLFPLCRPIQGLLCLLKLVSLKFLMPLLA